MCTGVVCLEGVGGSGSSSVDNHLPTDRPTYLVPTHGHTGRTPKQEPWTLEPGSGFYNNQVHSQSLAHSLHTLWLARHSYPYSSLTPTLPLALALNPENRTALQ